MGRLVTAGGSSDKLCTKQQPSLQPSQRHQAALSSSPLGSSTDQQPSLQPTQSNQSTYLSSMSSTEQQPTEHQNWACSQAKPKAGCISLSLVWALEGDKGRIMPEWVPLSDNKGWPLSKLASVSLWGQTFSAQSATCILLGGHGHGQSSRWPLSAPQWHNSSTKLLIQSEIKEGIT